MNDGMTPAEERLANRALAAWALMVACLLGIFALSEWATRSAIVDAKTARQELGHCRALAAAQDIELDELREALDKQREVLRANGLLGAP
jgi:hypothetical protein